MAEDCSHEVVMKDMCAVCGKDLRQREGFPGQRAEETSACVAVVHNIPELIVSRNQAISLGSNDQANLLTSRRLVLLVDLDQTVIHTTSNIVSSAQASHKEVYPFKDPGRNGLQYHMKLRPFAHQFFENLNAAYEMHICTFGVRWYAHRVARLIDPSGSFFSHRILSRDECFDPNTKAANLSALFPCGDNFVCIIDDREDVWHNSPNLIHVHPYRFWQHTGDINAPPNASDNVDAISKPSDNHSPYCSSEESEKVVEEAEKTEPVQSEILREDKIETDEEIKIVGETITVLDDDVSRSMEQPIEQGSSTVSDVAAESPSPPVDVGVSNCDDPDLVDPDRYLLYLERVLLRIHRAFYQLYDKMKARGSGTTEIPDLKLVVPYVRRKVLRDVRLVFSSVIPRNYDPSRSYEFNAATAFGATVQTDLVPPDKPNCTTHLVAAKPGTEKVRLARKYGGIKIVSTKWLHACVQRWERVSERKYLLPMAPTNAKTTSTNSCPPSTSGVSSQQLLSNGVTDSSRNQSPTHVSEGILSDCSVTEYDALSGRTAEKQKDDLPFFNYGEQMAMELEVKDLCSDEDEETTRNGENESDSNEDQSFPPQEDGQPAGSRKRTPRNGVDDEIPFENFQPTKRLKRSVEHQNLDSSSDSSVEELLVSKQDNDSEGESIGSVDQDFADALERELK